MALWGTKDLVYNTGNVNVNVTTGVVSKQSGAIAWTAGNGIKVGQVITVDGTAEGVIKSIDSATQLGITTEHLPGTNISNKTYVISEKPKSTLFDSKYAAGDIFGVDNAEVGVARTTAFSVTHGGWVGITSYIQNNADGSTTLRVKTETLVSMGRGQDAAGTADTGGISGDAENVKYTD